jgi:hypothetical protein
MASSPRLSAQTALPVAANAIGPKMTFDTNAYQFGKVVAGTLVKHVFIVSNAGDQTLKISRVTPGCHCTTAGDWTHEVEPGQTGKIPIQFDSGSFRGSVTKTIMVYSNDKLAPNQSLTLRGTIWRMLEVNPQFAYINIMPDSPSNSTSVVHIVNQSDEPVTLATPTSANPLFKAELKTVTPGKNFDVLITAVPPFAPGNSSGTISIKTSLASMPVLNITAIALVQPAVVVSPAQISLPSKIEGWTTNRVIISANGSKALALSDAQASDSRVSVEIKETNAGRVFQLAAIFPPGFQIAPGQRVNLTVKSNNSREPLITVPVRQPLRPPAAFVPMAHPQPMTQSPPQPPVMAHP